MGGASGGRNILPNRNERIASWLFGCALPWWLAHGIDRKSGGFHEKFDLDLKPVTADGKRLFVQARQIYVFSRAADRGALAGALDAADHGFAFIDRHYRRPDGGWRRLVDRDGTPLDDSHWLYDHAFVLFAMAWRYRVEGDPAAIAIADQTMGFLDERLAAPGGGYLEGLDPAGAPLAGPRRQNPHMHLLEALLALYETTHREKWLTRARGLLSLCRDRFVVGGTLRESFDADLRPAAGDEGRLVEPGHHFEWVWLLHKYMRATKDNSFANLADTLYGFAIAHGVDAASGGIVDTLDCDGAVVSRGRRLWPQCEALKAHAVRLRDLGDRNAGQRLDDLLDVVFRDHLNGPDGFWREWLDGDGKPVANIVPASSLYHIVFALTEILDV